jgi:2-polyprenyl-3-methyl-5-hydroxy-6-metoxy-1,4-benzoquinol methylase
LSLIETYDFANLNFSQCEKCNTIQLANLIPLNILYNKSHNLTSFGKLWEGYFNVLIEKIQTNIDKKNILEVGCPSGKIALNCKNYNKWYIVEPNKNDSIKFNDKIYFIQKFFDSNFTINDNIDMIIHSHLLEHIYEPDVFLKKCYELLNDEGEMIFGIPNMQYLADNELCLFVGVFFEHTIFMNKENITYLLSKNGFDVLEIIDYVNHSTIYHVKKQKIIRVCNSEIKIKNYYNDFIKCIDTYKLFINKCNLIISNTNKPVYIFGASYNTQFLLSMGLDIKYLTGLLDNSIEKQNKYLYGFDLLIYSPEILLYTDCIVIIKNSYYVNEIKDQLLNLNNNTQILM